jgi:DNA primase small subunit
MNLIRNNLNITFLKDLFRRYYFSRSNSISVPSEIQKREFGYMHFDYTMVRHLSYSNRGELIATLVKDTPLDVFCSNATYKFPANSLESKGWEGADLIFDLDLKDLNMSCTSDHSYYVCNQCSTCYENYVTVCSTCSDRNLSSVSIPCLKCMNALRNETEQLIELLKIDFGISEKNIETYFSGNAGFHIHVIDSPFNDLDSNARSDIIDYLSGNGLLPESIGVRKSKNDFYIKFPKSGISFGWRKRIATDLGINYLSISKFAKIVETSGGYNKFKGDLDKRARNLGVLVDPQVTRDVHRIFRLPGTINGKSSLIKARSTDIDTFKPYESACVLEDEEVFVKSKIPLKVSLKGRHFRIRNSIERLPAYAAAYLISKRLADIVR